MVERSQIFHARPAYYCLSQLPPIFTSYFLIWPPHSILPPHLFNSSTFFHPSTHLQPSHFQQQTIRPHLFLNDLTLLVLSPTIRLRSSDDRHGFFPLPLDIHKPLKGRLIHSPRNNTHAVIQKTTASFSHAIPEYMTTPSVSRM